MRPALPALVAGLLLACSPTFNWREVHFAGAGLAAQLPCKPDQGARTVTLAGREVEMAMIGCATGGATFAVAHVRWPAPADAGAALAHWRAATLAALHATAPRETAFALPGGLALPQAAQVRTDGAEADGSPVSAQVAWFARSAADGMHLYQATLYARRIDAEAAQAFVAGLRFE